MDCRTTWIQCCKSPCGKWRIVREEVAKKFENLPWSCEMNENHRYGKCSAPVEEIVLAKGKKVVLTKLPFQNGEIIMAKLSGYCSWPALICPDPYCNLYYDAILNEKDEEDEITHIHVEFFGWPRSHAWVSPNNISPFSKKNSKNTKSKFKSCKTNKSYQLAIKEASKVLLLSCEERLRNCTFKTIGDLSKWNKKEPLKRERNTTKKRISLNEKDYLNRYEKFMAEKGCSRIKSPVWNGKAISLFKIFQCVQNCGGYNEVSRRRMWMSLRDALLKNDNTFVKPSGNLKRFYERYMLDFEEHLKKQAQGKGVKKMRLNEEETFSADENHGDDLSKSTDLVSSGFQTVTNSLKHQDSDIKSSNTTLPLTHHVLCLSEALAGQNVDKQFSRKSGIVCTSLITVHCNPTYQDTETNVTTPLVTQKDLCPSAMLTEEVVDTQLANNLDGDFCAGLNQMWCDSPAACHKYLSSPLKQANVLKLLGHDFVPSSNPASPQILPNEEDLEDDCGTSIQRELEEMERFLDTMESASQGQRIEAKVTQIQDQLTNDDSWLMKDNEIKDAIRDILEIEKHISQLENSTELDN